MGSLWLLFVLSVSVLHSAQADDGGREGQTMEVPPAGTIGILCVYKILTCVLFVLGLFDLLRSLCVSPSPSSQQPATQPGRPGRLGWTVHRRRRVYTRKLAKRRNDHKELIRLLKILFGAPLPASTRESLAAEISSLAASTPWEDFEVPDPARLVRFISYKWLFKNVSARLPLESNTKIRSHLLFLLWNMVTRLNLNPHFFHSYMGFDRRTITGLLRLLEQDTTREERVRALRLLHFELYDNCAGETGLFGHQVVKAIVHVIEQHQTRGPYSDLEMRLAVMCLDGGVTDHNPSESLWMMIENEFAMEFIWNGLRNVESAFHEELNRAFLFMLSFASPADSTTLIIRYFDRLKETLERIDIRENLDFCYSPEFSGLFATTPTLMQRLWTMEESVMHTRHQCNFQDADCTRYRDGCEKVVFALESALDHGRLLEHLLGDGLLTVASHFATAAYDTAWQANRDRADTFRRILRRHPEWRAEYKKMTHRVNLGNPVADLSRTFPDRVSKKCNYYFIEED